MSASKTSTTHTDPPAELKELDSVQPGGGFCYRIELTWGRLRRWWLKRFRPGYVRRMAALRHGEQTGAPHEILDPRDLKYCRNRCSCYWAECDDRFAWRDRLGIARWGLAEVQIFGWPLAALTVGLLIYYPLLAVLPGGVLCLLLYFFRDPLRQIPNAPGLIVAPADGKVVSIERLEHEEYIGGPAIRIGIFMSIFNVHVNRAPCDARVVGVYYRPGEFRNALDPLSSSRNECTWIRLEDLDTGRRLLVRQISGIIARRIVCDLRAGDVLTRGQKFGMIKFGSRTELILPETEDMQLKVVLGQRVLAGTTVIAKLK